MSLRTAEHAAEHDPAAPQPTRTRVQRSAQPWALVVSTSVSLRFDVRDVLQPQGWSVSMERSLHRGHRAVKQYPWSLCLLDLTRATQPELWYQRFLQTGDRVPLLVACGDMRLRRATGRFRPEHVLADLVAVGVVEPQDAHAGSSD